MASPRPVDLIRAKRDGHSVSADDLTALINAYTADDVPDYQMSAFLMAAFLKGLDADETAALTRAMLHSGTVLDLSHTPGTKVDKHSTGGVGDKVSLILAPIVAACGVPVPMISGRGLGHTGGTLDKLESIPDFRTDLSIAAYKQQLADLGLVLIGQTAEIAPADRKLYALRDVTGTVECIPLIAASIMSKKLAEGIDGLVLDVKCGRGAFMSSEADARRLAETLVSIGHEFGKATVARMTRMDAPLGRAVGNWPEMQESIQCLQGDVEGLDDLMTVTLALAGEMLWLGGEAASPEAGVAQAQEAIDSGAAFDTFARVVDAQGGDVTVVHDPAARAGMAPAGTVAAPATGYVQAIDAFAVGMTAVRMGAGRRVKEDPVDPTAGLVLHKKVGEAVAKGDPLATLYTARTEDIPAFSSAIGEAYTLADTAPPAPDMLLGRYTMEGWTD
ncbi:MAG: thymidine phosphorylase [Bacteroidetes bacterium]|jgi:pyrimidine-nucleoside phosphorylase|nr:thymidine phosphorylase [Bacteroidota bacterium]